MFSSGQKGLSDDADDDKKRDCRTRAILENVNNVTFLVIFRKMQVLRQVPTKLTQYKRIIYLLLDDLKGTETH